MTDIKEMMEEAKGYLDDVINRFTKSFLLRILFYREIDKLRTAKEMVETTEIYASLHEQNVVNAIYNSGEIVTIKNDGTGRKEN